MLATMDWVQWYNEDRIHSYSADMPPRKYEEIHYQALETGKTNEQFTDIAASRLAGANHQDLRAISAAAGQSLSTALAALAWSSLATQIASRFSVSWMRSLGGLILSRLVRSDVSWHT